MVIRRLTTRLLVLTVFRKPRMALTEDLQPEARRTILTPGLPLTQRRLPMPMGARKPAQRITHTLVRLPPPSKARTGTALGEVPRPSLRMVRAPTRNTTPRHREQQDRYRLLLAERLLVRVAPTAIAQARARRQTATCMPAQTEMFTRTPAAAGKRPAAMAAGIP